MLDRGWGAVSSSHKLTGAGGGPIELIIRDLIAERKKPPAVDMDAEDAEDAEVIEAKRQQDAFDDASKGVVEAFVVRPEIFDKMLQAVRDGRPEYEFAYVVTKGIGKWLKIDRPQT